MVIGDIYRITSPTLGLRNLDPIKSIVTPAGAYIRITGPPNERHLVPCRWDSIDLMLFAVDIVSRGEQIKSISDCVKLLQSNGLLRPHLPLLGKPLASAMRRKSAASA